MFKPSSEPTYRQVRLVGMISVAFHILATCCRELPVHSRLYHHKGKYLTKQLLDFVLPLVTLINSQENIKAHFEKTKQLIDRDDLVEDNDMHVGCVDDLMTIMSTKSTSEVFAMSLILQNIKEGKKVYTQNEVDFLLNESRN